MRRFAKTIVKVLIAYADIVKKEFPEQMKDERIVSECKTCGRMYESHILIYISFLCIIFIRPVFS